MQILLLQDAVYFPSYGGGNKANRLLLTELAARGHQCHSVCKAWAARQGRERQADAPVLAARGIAIEREDRERISYRCDGVHVDALNLAAGQMAPCIDDAIQR